jgi:hypothetical protein
VRRNGPDGTSPIVVANVTSYALVVDRRDPMIELHLRISRKLVVALVVIFVVLPVIWMLFQTLGASSSKLKLDPVRTVTTP